MKLTHTISKEEASLPIKDILKNTLTISNKLLTKLKQTESIIVNGFACHSMKYLVKKDDVILIDFEQMEQKLQNTVHFKDKFVPLYKPLSILYEDEYLLIVEKSAGVPVHPSCDHYLDTLSNIVCYYLSQQNIYDIHIVTRLDKDTSGICIFAKHSYIQELFTRKKEEIQLQKNYIAIVDGILKEKNGIIEKNIIRKEDSIIARTTTSDFTQGDYAKTEYHVLEYNTKYSYSVLQILLHTGRTHQIRVHMASIGHVLLGDDFYAKEYQVDNILTYIQRQALHAYHIEFFHPITKQKISITSLVPQDMKQLIHTRIPPKN